MWAVLAVVVTTMHNNKLHIEKDRPIAIYFIMIHNELHATKTDNKLGFQQCFSDYLRLIITQREEQTQ